MLIINADDFGADSPTNKAILDAFERGLCSSTTLMANMPAFEEACQSVREKGLARRVGLHLNLTCGAPLSEAIRTEKKFCDADGRLCLTRTRRVVHLNGREREAVTEEMRAQIRRCRDHGVPITHLDSHHHAHEEWAIASVVIRVAREQGVPCVRLARSFIAGAKALGLLYRRMVNLRLRRAGLARTTFFGSLLDYAAWRASDRRLAPGESFEIMTHPGYSASGVLVDKFAGQPLEILLAGIEGHGLAESFDGLTVSGQGRSDEAKLPYRLDPAGHGI